MADLVRKHADKQVGTHTHKEHGSCVVICLFFS